MWTSRKWVLEKEINHHVNTDSTCTIVATPSSYLQSPVSPVKGTPIMTNHTDESLPNTNNLPEFIFRGAQSIYFIFFTRTAQASSRSFSEQFYMKDNVTHTQWGSLSLFKYELKFEKKKC